MSDLTGDLRGLIEREKHQAKNAATKEEEWGALLRAGALTTAVEELERHRALVTNLWFAENLRGNDTVRAILRKHGFERGDQT